MISYQILNDSIEYYELQGFNRIESPWTVTKAISNITKPEGVSDFSIAEKNKVLVASAEQSFLYLYNKGFLPKGRFQSITPCFRDETFDELHTKYFMKNELIDTQDVTNLNLKHIVKVAQNFFNHYLGGGVECMIMDDNQYDLEYHGIELGSYGIRQCDFLKWIYATGVAEPRLSNTMKKFGKLNEKVWDTTKRK